MDNVNDEIRDSVKIETGSAVECDFTGLEIEKMVPHLKLFNNIRMSEKGVRVLKSSLDGDETSLYDITIEKTKSGKCDTCEQIKGDRIRMSLIGGTMSQTVVKCFCKNCWGDLMRVCEEGFDTIEDNILFYDDSGFKIIKLPREVEIDTAVSDSKDKTDMLLKVCCDCDGQSVEAPISKISDLIEELKLSNGNNSLVYERTSIEIEKCDSCNCKKEKIFDVGIRNKICEECKDYLIDSLEEYVEKNQEMIVSRKI